MTIFALPSAAVAAAAATLATVLIGAAAASAPPAAPAAHAPLPSPGCGKSARSGAFALTASDGLMHSRSYRIEVPSDYSPAKPYPIIFVFHGAGSTSAQSEGWGLQKAAGAAENGIFIFPTGVPFQSYGVGWDDRAKGYDLPFFDHMLKDVEAAYCIDQSRIFVAGFSWGGDFAIALACERGDVLRAVAVNSASDDFNDKGNPGSYLNLPCPAHAHPPIRFEHAVGGDAQYAPPYFATTATFLQTLNGCSATSAPVTSSSPGMACVAFNGCQSALVECPFDPKLGHVLPPHWAENTWQFFMAQ